MLPSFKESTDLRSVHVALLRGINVGGRNRIAMKALAAIFAASGGRDVRTYIQSGNVVFQAPRARANLVLAEAAERIADCLGNRIPLVAREAEEWVRIASAHPFGDATSDSKALHVGLLQHEPLPDEVARLDPERSPPDRLSVRGREVYLLLPCGMARTKFTNAYFDSALGTPCTFRNWRTVRALAEMVGQGAVVPNVP